MTGWDGANTLDWHKFILNLEYESSRSKSVMCGEAYKSIEPQFKVLFQSSAAMDIGVGVGEESEHTAGHTATFKILKKLVQAYAKAENVPFHDLE